VEESGVIMGRKNLYTVRGREKGLFEVIKFDEDLNPEETYHISELDELGASVICTCFAGSKPTCRHRQMVRVFQAENRIDSGWMYNFDKKQWFKPYNALTSTII
jgi:hypothetical protein